MRTDNSERVSDALGGCDAVALAQAFGTPLVVLDEACVRAQMRRFRAAFDRQGWTASVTYAGKALLIARLAGIAHEEGLAIDVCSLGELLTALRGGVPPARCIMHGCFKTDDELRAAVERGVGLVVVDHRGEIERLDELAGQSSARVDVLVRLNPSIAARTHDAIQTSAPASKFGFAIEDGQALAAVKRVLDSRGLRFRGLHCHLGSQIRELQTYVRAIDALAAFAADMVREAAAACEILDLGGGIAVGTESGVAAPSPEAWADALFGAVDERFVRGGLSRPTLCVEPGRALVADAGTTLYRIGVRKRLPDGTDAVIVDGGMSDNPRPALYHARYQAYLPKRPDAKPDGIYEIFGRHCETDRLISAAPLPDPQPGDVLAVRGTGAYTYSMASNYNRFPRPAVVLAADGDARLIARRESIERVIELDTIDAS
jgi:diaminopimelate decarboxylase